MLVEFIAKILYAKSEASPWASLSYLHILRVPNDNKGPAPADISAVGGCKYYSSERYLKIRVEYYCSNKQNQCIWNPSSLLWNVRAPDLII